MGYVGLKISYSLEGEPDTVANWHSITVDVHDQSLREFGSRRYGYAWATNRVKEHRRENGEPELGVHVFDIDRSG